MNALITYYDYFWIALFTIGLYNGAKIVWLIIESKIDNYLRKKRYAPRLINTFDLLESSYTFGVTMGEVEKALQDDIKQGLIASYTIGDDFIVYREKSGLKGLIDLTKYDVELE